MTTPQPGSGGQARVLGLDDLDVISKTLQEKLEIKDRTWLFKTYKRCFVGKDLAKLLVDLKLAGDSRSAVEVGNQLMRKRIFRHVWEAGVDDFHDSHVFYRFSFHDKILGGKDLNNISHTYVLKTCERLAEGVTMVEYKKDKLACTGEAVVSWLLKEGTALSEEEASTMGQLFLACRLIEPVVPRKGEAKAFTKSDLYRTVSISKGPKKAASGEPVLGVLRLQYGYPPIPGDIDHPNSFPYKVVYRQVKGLTFELAQSGKLTDEVRDNFIIAIRELESLGVFGITGDCGFMANYQRFVADTVVKVPVFMSSLSLIPAILGGMNSNAKLVVVTANSESLAELFPNRYDAPLGPEDLGKCSVSNVFFMEQLGCTVAKPERIVNMGLQDLPGFEAVADAVSLLSMEVDRVLVGKEITKRVLEFIATDTTVQGILLECTELPHFSAPLLRSYTGLPVWDSLSVCDFFHGAVEVKEAEKRRSVCVGHHCQRGLPDTLIH